MNANTIWSLFIRVQNDFHACINRDSIYTRNVFYSKIYFTVFSVVELMEKDRQMCASHSFISLSTWYTFTWYS